MYFPYRKESTSCIRSRRGLLPNHLLSELFRPFDAGVTGKIVRLLIGKTSKKGDKNETLGNAKR